MITEQNMPGKSNKIFSTISFLDLQFRLLYADLVSVLESFSILT